MRAFKSTTILIIALLASLTLTAQDEKESYRKYYELTTQGFKLNQAGEHEKAIECYEKANEYCSDRWINYQNWGIALIRTNDSIKAKDGIEKLRHAIELAYNITDDKKTSLKLDVATGIGVLGEITNNANLIEETIEIYKSLENNQNLPSYFYSNWGGHLLNISKLKNRTKKDKDIILNKLFQAYHKNPAQSSLNIACLYSVLNNEKEANLWLKEALLSQEITIRDIDKEIDLDNIKKSREFKKLIKIRSIYEDQQQFVIDSLQKTGIEIDMNESKEYLSSQFVDKYIKDLGGFENTENSCYDIQSYSSQSEEDLLSLFFRSNYKLPRQAREFYYETPSKIIVQFTLNKNNKLSRIKTAKSIFKNKELSKTYDKEAIRVVKQLPDWILIQPFIQQGQDCKIIEVNFGDKTTRND